MHIKNSDNSIAKTNTTEITKIKNNCPVKKLSIHKILIFSDMQMANRYIKRRKTYSVPLIIRKRKINITMRSNHTCQDDSHQKPKPKISVVKHMENCNPFILLVGV